MDKNGSPVTSVDRALRILQLVGTAERGLTLDELASELAMPKSSVHRILGALKYRGFAAQPEVNGPYFLGSEMLATAFRFHEALDLRTMIHPLLVRLRDELGETVHMAVLDGAEIVYLDKVEVANSIKMTSVIGGRNPAHSTGVGKALLAWTYPTSESLRIWVERFQPLPARTRYTKTTAHRLAEQAQQVRDLGYALDLEENEIGVRCVAVPVFLGGSAPSAAISITTLKGRTATSRLRELGELLGRGVADVGYAIPR